MVETTRYEETVRQISRHLLPTFIVLTLGWATLLPDQSSADVIERQADNEGRKNNSHRRGEDHPRNHQHTGRIAHPEDARKLGLDSLHLAVQKDRGVPLPSNLDEFVKDRWATIQLGKALFWDMQVGSDGVQACASCHFHAGTDNRITNAINPDEGVVDVRVGDVIGYSNAGQARQGFETKKPNETLTREDFPFVKVIDVLTRMSDGTIAPGANNSNDVVGSMGVKATRFDGVQPGLPLDLGAPLLDPVFSDGKVTVRAIEHRNTPSVINAVFNFTNFWDGRANPHFTGRTPFGDQDQAAAILVNRPGAGLIAEHISIDNASLASQAVAPPINPVEMAFGDPSSGNGRRLRELGQKLLRPTVSSNVPLTPLGGQYVHPYDSVLGQLSKAPGNGLSTTYEAMIRKAFVDVYWNSKELTELPSMPTLAKFTQMEVNFGLFFGLAIAMYEATLVADRAPFDEWMETGHFNHGFHKKELAGLNVFVNEGKCIHCHAGPELTNASVRSAKGEQNLIRAMAMVKGTALYDNGFYNLGVTPTTDDIGRGDVDIFGQPLSFTRQALFDRLSSSLGTPKMGFPILGNGHLPGKDEDVGLPVCEDVNADGFCEPNEPMKKGFQRVAADGAFKVPGLRNVELTGPYFHNGGMATLRQVVQFYNRGGNFCRFNENDVHLLMAPLRLTEEQEEQLVAFLISLTDSRVKYQQTPFDHPELRIPRDGTDAIGMLQIEAVGSGGSWKALQTFLNLDPLDAIFTPQGTCER